MTPTSLPLVVALALLAPSRTADHAPAATTVELGGGALGTPGEGAAAYLALPIAELAYDDGRAPDFTGSLWCSPDTLAALAPYAVVEGARAVHLGLPVHADWTLPRAELGQALLGVELLERAADAPDLRGRVYLPDARATRLVAHPFTLAVRRATAEPSEEFLRARQRHYAWRFEHGLPGGAWWRNRAAAEAEVAPSDAAARSQLQSRVDVSRSYALLSGGRAVSENLRLDDIVRSGGGEAATVPLAGLEGITTPALDWSRFELCAPERLDPLARFVPADHHAVFLPSFDAFVRVVDELRRNGTPVLDLLEPAAEDADVQGRYQRQLALELDVAARALGAHVVRSIAVTGGDPYLRTGSDLALLFDCAEPELLLAFVEARIAERARAKGLAVQERSISGVALRGAADATRELSSWCVASSDVVIVANSAPLAARLAGVARGDEPSLAGLDEYRHFRARYPRGTPEEAAFVVLTDGAIRRWCSPRWRIASARRVRAGALLAEAEAARAAVEFGVAASFPPSLPDAVPDFGVLVDDARGLRSERYGTTRFATPIAELDLDHVTPSELAGYRDWRFVYDQQWSNVFDPIAAQVSITPDGLALDLSVLPIALRSEYGDLIDLAGATRLAPDAGDPHQGALAHFVLALDRDGPALRQLEGVMAMIAPSIERPLAWVGDHVALWLDGDAELLAKARAAEDRDEFLAEHGFELPVGVQLAVRDPLRLAAFLGAIKALLESAAPGAVAWETRELSLADGTTRSYVAVTPREGAGWEDTPSVFYGIVPGRLVASLREDVLRRALERTGAVDPAEGPPRPRWLGESVGARFGEGFKELLEVGLVEAELRNRLRRQAFSALPILNELRRMAPDADPVALQAQLFGAAVRCPGGGRMVWNEEQATFESTVFGCPAAPRDGDVLPAAVRVVRSLSLGLTFDRLDERLHALRARAQADRR